MSVYYYYYYYLLILIKGSDFYILPPIRKPGQQRFTIGSSVLASIGSNQCSAAISGHPGHYPNKWTLDPAVCSYNRPTYAPASHTMAFTPQCYLAMTRYFLVASSVTPYYQILIVALLSILDGWKAELA